jgi:hypothetical protein
MFIGGRVSLFNDNIRCYYKKYAHGEEREYG